MRGTYDITTLFAFISNSLHPVLVLDLGSQAGYAESATADIYKKVAWPGHEAMQNQ